MKLIKSVITVTLMLTALLYLQSVPSESSLTVKPERIIRLATTTSTDNSGLLDYLLPEFEQKTGYRVHVIAVGTGKALRMGSDGDADVLLVHAPAAERAFVETGYGEKRNAVMYNDFILVGAASNPANIKANSGINDALRQIAAHQATFISRGDNSGTHKKELSLWQAENIHPNIHPRINPRGNWYREVGQGMGKVLQMAAELDAYTLTDRGTWLAYQDKSSLRILHQGDPKLYNPYHIIAVNPERFPGINYQGAKALIAWITSRRGQALIGAFMINDSQLFKPSASARQLATQITRP